MHRSIHTPAFSPALSIRKERSAKQKGGGLTTNGQLSDRAWDHCPPCLSPSPPRCEILAPLLCPWLRFPRSLRHAHSTVSRALAGQLALRETLRQLVPPPTLTTSERRARSATAFGRANRPARGSLPLTPTGGPRRGGLYVAYLILHRLRALDQFQEPLHSSCTPLTAPRVPPRIHRSSALVSFPSPSRPESLGRINQHAPCPSRP